MKVLIGGGSQRGLQRALDSCVGLGLSLDYLPSDAEAQVWRRKASRADVAVVRTGLVSHKAWVNVKAFCPRVIPVPENGEGALLRAIQSLAQEGACGYVSTFVDMTCEPELHFNFTKEPQMGNAEHMVNELKDDPAASYWLRRAAGDMLKRDPLDAMNDARTLLDIATQMYKDATENHQHRLLAAIDESMPFRDV